jgi:hypothetical protein
LVTSLLFSFALLAPANEEATLAPLNQAIVKFASDSRGRQVGNGECAILAYEAMKSANAAKMGADFPADGDYVWGELIAIYKGSEKGPDVEVIKDKVRPGDIVQYRDAFFETRTETMVRRMTASHHTAIVSWAGGDGSLWKVMEQKVNDNLKVGENVLPLAGLKSGWLRVYRALPASASTPVPPK